MPRLVVAVLLLLVGCSSSGGASADRPPPAAATTPSAGQTSVAEATPAGRTAEPSGRPRSPSFDQALHDELIAMLERDQSGRTGGPDPEGDAARTARLAEILDTHGWPTYALVGEDGEDAAWAVAQHSDADPAFQRRALELLRRAVADGQASPGNLAYLEDRVAVGAGQPQLYGTQVGCGPDGPVPATPIADQAAVDERRAAAGLDPLADYLAEMTTICAEE
ncbi:hypothetical protein GCU56_20775 [Geodermatophilus sabuli]|uniref:Lipoprotein n=1 Tax=Geodermatophilus sabuli TaxID=1564158 RepID=A0A7K3W5Z2_9ACTN|nr:hypothetical protein [Geodermatophilus sabuli]